VIKEKWGHRVDRVVHAMFPFLFIRPIHPDLITVGGAVVSLVAAGLFARGEFVTAGVVMFVGGLFDLTDGVVARHWGISTTFGGFLDSTLDRFVDMVILLGIALYYSGAGEAGLALLTGYVLVCSVLTSYAKARAELHLEHLPGGMLERGERMAFVVLGAVSGYMEVVLGLLALGTTYTVGQRLYVAYREMARLDAGQTVPSTEVTQA